MRINSRFWIVVSIASLIIIILNFYNFNKSEKYIFSRNYKYNHFKEIELSSIDLRDSDGSKVSGGELLSYELEPTKNKNLLFNGRRTNIFTGKSKNIKTKLPERPTFFEDDKLYFIHKYRLGFAINDQIHYINIKSFKAFYIFPISNNKILLLGELQEGDSFTTGFFIYNQEKDSLINNKILKVSSSSLSSENMLIFQGSFSKNKEGISYNFLTLSKIYLFNLDGTFRTEIDTKEKVPIPEIIGKQMGDNQDTMYVYKRGKTYVSNIGSFRKKDTLFIISHRINEMDDFLTIDKYSISKNKYEYSLKLNYRNKNNRDILYVSQSNDSVFLIFKDSALLLEN